MNKYLEPINSYAKEKYLAPYRPKYPCNTSNVNSKLKQLSFILLLSISSIITYSQTFVNINATGANKRTSWANAYTDLQTASDNVSTGGQVWVAAGTYVPTESPDGVSTGLRDRAFDFDQDVLLYGSFTGGESTLSQRTTGHETILSGDLNGDETTIENTYHVLITADLTTATLIDGVTITKGNANGLTAFSGITYSSKLFFRQDGGYIYNFQSSLSITNVNFNSNTAIRGGGMFNSNSSPNIYNTAFWNNTKNSTINDIANIGTSTPTGSNNASDGTNAPATTSTLTPLTINPFTNSSNSAGTDGIFGTTDDGLIPTIGSVLIDARNNAQNTTSLGLAKNPRILNNSIDIGAYEIFVDDTAPRITSITRQALITNPTNSNALTWNVRFNEVVKNVNPADFIVSGTTASIINTDNSPVDDKIKSFIIGFRFRKDF